MEAALSTFVNRLDIALSAIALYKDEELIYKSNIKNLDLYEDSVAKTELASWISLHKKHESKKKILLYYNVIIMAYGALEQFIDSTIESVIYKLNAKHLDFDKMPGNLIKSHSPQSIELMKKVNERPDLFKLNEEEIIENLLSCQKKQKNFILNKEAFTKLRKGNYKFSILESALNQIGVENCSVKLSNNVEFVTFYDSEPPDQVQANIRSELDDLSQRRNEISHGEEVNNILNEDMLAEKLNFLSILGNALFDLLNDYYLESVSKEFSKKLGKPVVVFGGNIVCLKIKNTVVRVGDYLIAYTNDTKIPFKCSRIEEIQLDNKPYKRIVVKDPQKVAFKVSYKAKKSWEYCHLKGSY